MPGPEFNMGFIREQRGRRIHPPPYGAYSQVVVTKMGTRSGNPTGKVLPRGSTGYVPRRGLSGGSTESSEEVGGSTMCWRNNKKLSEKPK